MIYVYVISSSQHQNHTPRDSVERANQSYCIDRLQQLEWTDYCHTYLYTNCLPLALHWAPRRVKSNITWLFHKLAESQIKVAVLVVCSRLWTSDNDQVADLTDLFMGTITFTDYWANHTDQVEDLMGLNIGSVTITDNCGKPLLITGKVLWVITSIYVTSIIHTQSRVTNY